MPIKDYTTKISAEQSIGEIQGILRKVKVRGVGVGYAEDGEPTSLSFDLDTAWGHRSYMLPVDIDNVQRVLLKQTRTSHATREQSVRVAWRLAKDWVDVQIAYVEAGAALFEQVMLPYMRDENTGATVYEMATSTYQKALPAAKK